MKKNALLIAVFLLSISMVFSQDVSIYEKNLNLKTYPFSDPNPVPDISRIYPYFDFQGYTNNSVQKNWKMVVLENDYIKVYVCPEIGGKVWGAVEKSTGKEFLYFNHVVKFRDVAMRGPWTSGGLEYNFGDIGHAPSCSTPVDYVMKENEDGSVSCVLGAIDLPSETKWNVEISLYPGNAFFETKVSWFNNTDVPTSYYHWMNAAAKASDDLEFIYPGNKAIGHGGKAIDWPENEGRNLTWYKNNNFGSYKSYHVINSYTGFFGGYWHDDDFGFGHWSSYDDKPGKKLWIWGLSDQGMIWEDLLTDSDGQYIEFQAGKLFNQAANSSTLTPFKHKEFHPHDVDIMHETWFPLKKTGGMVAASPYGIFNVEEQGDSTRIVLSVLQQIDDELQLLIDGKQQLSKQVVLKPLEIFELAVKSDDAEKMKIILGDSKLEYSALSEETLVNRPVELNPGINWESAYALFTKGIEVEKQRMYNEAMDYYFQAVKVDPGFLPALNRIALSYYRQMKYLDALSFARKALSIDTYNGEANYIFGLVNRELGLITDAKSGFSIAMMDIAYRSAASTELANLFVNEQNYARAEYYATRALTYNRNNLQALEILAIAYRQTNEPALANTILDDIFQLDATHHFIRFEKYLLKPNEENKKNFQDNITNELPIESYLDLAINYYKKGCTEEAMRVLEIAPENPIVNLWRAYLDNNNAEVYLNKCLEGSPGYVFPHRRETAAVLSHFLQENNHWKLKYYLALVYLKIGVKDKGIEYFEACGNEPDFAPFWLAKVNLADNKNDRFTCLQKAYNLEPDEWRPSFEMAGFYLENIEPAKALEITSGLTEKYKEQSAIGITHTRVLIELKKYIEAISFLDAYTVLPFEGATIGRDLYHEACLKEAFQSFKSKDYKKAIKYAEKAKSWPANLGVGKPYDVDERMEDFLLAQAFKKLGSKKKAKVFEEKVMGYFCPDYKQENSRLYLQLLALKQNKREEEAKELLKQHQLNSPDNLYLQWVKEKFNDTSDAVEIKRKIVGTESDNQPYDSKFIDKEFITLLDLLSIMEQYR